MKFTILFLSLSLSLLTFAQTPKTISYQGVARNATGQPIPKLLTRNINLISVIKT